MLEAHDTPDPTRCHGHNRKGAPCGRRAKPGLRVCYSHGGAPGSGAPQGNQNARKFGFYSRRIQEEDRDRLSDALTVDGLADEIALVRVLIEKAVAAGADLTTVSRGVEVLTRAVRVQHAMDSLGGDGLTDAIARVFEDLGGQMGLPEALT